MRKEEEPEQLEEAKVETKSRTRGPRKPVVDAEEENMGEDTLLGESTLAKLNVSRKADEVEVKTDDAAAG